MDEQRRDRIQSDLTGIRDFAAELGMQAIVEDALWLLDALTAAEARAARLGAEVAMLRATLREVHDHVVSLDWDAANGKWHYVERELPKLLAIVKPFAALADPRPAENSCQIPPKV